MKDELLPYYESELTFLRQMSAEYAEKYPKVASRLKLRSDICEDPHVERLIESFALLAARVHRKIDQEFPEITASVLETLYPHYLRPVPSMAIAQFDPDPSQSAVVSGTDVPSGTEVFSRPDRRGESASFRTCYPLKLWPLDLADAKWIPAGSMGGNLPGDVSHAIRLTLRSRDGIPWSKLRVPSLRFYLNGQGAYIHTLYELLFTRTVGVRVHFGSAAASAMTLPADSIRAVGFGGDEGLLPYSNRSFVGYRLIQEFFHFPEKFMFFDLQGLDTIGPGETGLLEVEILLEQLPGRDRLPPVEQALSAQTFQLGCVPIVNLFERTGEPIRLTHTRNEYRVISDQNRQATTEVYSVDGVASLASYGAEPRKLSPFYAFRYPYEAKSEDCFWIARRRPAREGRSGSDVFLSLVDLDFDPAVPAMDRLTPYLTCTNRDFCDQLDWRREYGELQVEAFPALLARFASGLSRAASPPMGGGLQWRLISHLSLNHLSLVDHGAEALRDILRVYDFIGSPEVEDRIRGIASVHSEPGASRVGSPTGVQFCRGTEVTVEFDSEKFTGSGPFLMASVLERFLGLYAATNSYARLTARTQKEILKRWPPRTGEQILL